MIYLVGKPDMAAADLIGLDEDVTADLITATNRARALASRSEPYSVFKLVEVATFTGRKEQ